MIHIELMAFISCLSKIEEKDRSIKKKSSKDIPSYLVDTRSTARIEIQYPFSFDGTMRNTALFEKLDIL